MFRFPTKIYYWHSLVFLVVFRYFLVCLVDLWQYYYLTTDTVPSELSSILTKKSWDICRNAAQGDFKFRFWESFALSSSHLILVGLGVLRSAWNGLDVILRIPNPVPRIFGFGRMKSILFFLIYELLTVLIIIPVIFSWRNFVYDKGILPQDLDDLLLSSFQVILLTQAICFGIRRKKMLLIVAALVISVFASRIVYAPIKAKFMNAWAETAENKIFFDFLKQEKFPAENVFYEKDYSNVSQSGIGSWSFILVGGRLETKYKQRKEEILAIIAHEICHWKNKHILVEATITSVNWLLKVLSFFLLIKNGAFYRSFGFVDVNNRNLPLGFGMVILRILGDNLDFFLKPLENLIFWQLEYQADAFACNHGYGDQLVSAIKKLKGRRPSSIVTTRLYALFHSDHPTFADRINSIRQVIV